MFRSARASWLATDAIAAAGIRPVARADAGGFELLDAVQDGFDFVELDVQFRISGFEDFFEAFVQ